MRDLLEVKWFNYPMEATCPFDSTHRIGTRFWKISRFNYTIWYSDLLRHLFEHTIFRIEPKIPFNLTLFFQIFPKRETALQNLVKYGHV